MKIKSKVKSVFGLLLYFFYFILNIIFYRKKKRIAFISFPDASDNSWYLYKHAVKNLKGYNFIWLLSDNSARVKNKIISLNVESGNKNSVTLAKRWSIKGFVLFSSSRFVFFTHGTYYFIKPAFNAPTLVNLWHGMPIKAIGLLDGKSKEDICYSDYLIATSEFYRKIMADAFDMNLDQVLTVGLPRNDVLYTGASDFLRNHILETIGVSEKKSILVWLPTYRVSTLGDIRNDAKNASFLDDLDNDFLEELNDICSNENIVIVVKLHPMDSMVSKLKGFSFSNIVFYDAQAWLKLDIELYDLISISKGVISDFSSVMIDCLSTNIPVGFIRLSQVNYSRKVVVPVDKLLESIFVINSPSDVLNMISDDESEFELKCRGAFFNSCGGEASSKLFELLNIR